MVLITGAGNGIGRALAHESLHRGAIVIAVERDATALASLTADHAGANLVCHSADVVEAKRMKEIVAQTVADFGKLDIVIANAGVERIEPMWLMGESDFEDVINVNVLGVYRTLKAALDPVIASGGHLVAMSSVAGLLPFAFGAAYSSSKAAVDMMMRVLRMELTATNATAGAAYFGFISSDMGNRVVAHPGVAALSKWMPRRLLGLDPILPPHVAARRVCDDIERRKARSYTPRIISVTYALRGLLALSDDFLSRHVMRLPKFVAEFYGVPESDAKNFLNQTEQTLISESRAKEPH